MSTISFDRDEYKAGETATITYVDAPSDGYIQIVAPNRTYPYTKSKSGSGTDTWVIPTDAPLGQYTVELWSRSFRNPKRDTMQVVSDGAPTPPSDGVEEAKLSPGQHEIKWALSNYDTLTSTIEVTKTGVICIHVVDGVCRSIIPPSVSISGWAVTGHLKPSGVAPPTNFSGWVTSKGGKDAITYADTLEIGDAYIGLADVGFTVTYSHVLTCGDYYLGLG